MVRQDVVINNYKYIVDVYKAETADLTENRYAEFVMLRNYELSNDIINDKEQNEIKTMLIDAAACATSAMEHMPLDDYVPLFENILYHGMWSRFKSEDRGNE